MSIPVVLVLVQTKDSRTLLYTGVDGNFAGLCNEDFVKMQWTFNNAVPLVHIAIGATVVTATKICLFHLLRQTAMTAIF